MMHEGKMLERPDWRTHGCSMVKARAGASCHTAYTQFSNGREAVMHSDDLCLANSLFLVPHPNVAHRVPNVLRVQA